MNGSQRPAVSVVVPNYNHARFLEARLESILAQTFSDFEVVLLDDASADGSQAVLERYRSHPRVASVVLNRSNGGNVFAQWQRGVDLARGELVWIAESDDEADPRLLETLAPPLLGERRLGLAFGRSRVIDADDRQATLFGLPVVPDESDPRFATTFTMDGGQACADLFCFTNVVYNASAAVFRRSAYVEVGGVDRTMRLCGDWDLWVKILCRSDLHFAARELNRFRTHGQTVRAATAGDPLILREYLRIIELVAARTSPERPIDSLIFFYLSRFVASPRMRPSDHLLVWRAAARHGQLGRLLRSLTGHLARRPARRAPG